MNVLVRVQAPCGGLAVWSKCIIMNDCAGNDLLCITSH
jgi:hypothetical protein